MEAIATEAGVATEVIRFGVLLFSGFVLSTIYRFLPHNTTLKHSFSIITTSFLTVTVFNLQTLLENLSLCMIVYLLILNFRSKTWTPLVCFLVALAFMSHVHYQCQIVNPNGSSDHSAMMMVLLIKMSSFGYCAYDGTKPDKELDHYQQEHCIREIPSLIEYLGYCLFFNGVWAGPAFEFRQYRNFIEQKV
jgi:lysophospholipid acyltransferase